MPKTAVKVENLNYKIGKNTILENINFEIFDGESISIVGPNGAGKTTLLKILLGLRQNYDGKVQIFGADPGNAVSVRRIGYVPQVKTIDRNFPATAEELVANGIRRSWAWHITKSERNKIIEALENTGVEYLLKRNIATLSGGELQRVFVSRALVGKPELLILDEPSTGVDMKAESDISKIIGDYKLNYDAAVITVTHDWDAAFYHSDKIIMLNRKIYAFDIPELAFTEENLRALFGHLGHLHGMNFTSECRRHA